ncbi:ATP-dependent helicase HrpB [Pelagibaculum spongiae]|nr:ATP-dependent helicase HrpB [Pelagibaculum spongiae]
MTMIQPEQMLPIEPILPDICQQLSQYNQLLLQAPPGAGKTTRVPLALLESIASNHWLGDKKILLLEPRRLAASNAAKRMAQSLKQSVGETIGLSMRFEHLVSKNTRIEVVTEAILTRRLQNDPELSDIGLVIFDEVHERHLQTDLGLALTLECQQALREDLRIMLMSATLDNRAFSSVMPQAQVVTSQGKSWPVDIIYPTLNQRGQVFWFDQFVNAMRLALTENTAADGEKAGDVLAFLPGSGDIKRAERILAEASWAEGLAVLPLYGDLGWNAQQQVLQPDPQGRRKLILSTPIAESSLTIDGVSIVIDSGLCRRPVFDPASGMSKLTTQTIAKDSAEQRTGRAGRQMPGVCYRIYGESRFLAMAQVTTPEIEDADLSSLVLELACWGSTAEQIQWPSQPPAAALQQACDLLQQLQLIKVSAAQQQQITVLGKTAAKLPVHPRLAAMLINSSRQYRNVAADLAAILGERDPLFSKRNATGNYAGSGRDTDLDKRLIALQRFRQQQPTGADKNTLKRIDRSAKQILKLLKNVGYSNDQLNIAELLATAWPDRVAKLRANSHNRYQLANGRGAELELSDSLCDQPWLVIAEMDAGTARAGKQDGRIYRALAIGQTQLEQLFADKIESCDQAQWDETAQRAVGQKVRKLGAIILQHKKSRLTAEAAANIQLEQIQKKGLSVLPWDKPSLQLVNRVQLLNRFSLLDADFSQQALLASAEDWLLSGLMNCTGANDWKKIDLYQSLLSILSWPEQQLLEQQAPQKFAIPSGRNASLEYRDDGEVLLSVKMQEMFGAATGPAVAQRRQPVTLSLLSPAGRPLQMTRDLAGFWAGSYAEVRKEMRGRYPKHRWPEDPANEKASVSSIKRK